MILETQDGEAVAKGKCKVIKLPYTYDLVQINAPILHVGLGKFMFVTILKGMQDNGESETLTLMTHEKAHKFFEKRGMNIDCVYGDLYPYRMSMEF